MFWEQPTTDAYRAFYYWLHEVVDREIARVLAKLESTKFADNTIVIFTSDHGDLLGSHGGLQQKWYNAYDETIRVPLIVAGAGIPHGVWDTPTSHLDLLPTLLGFAGIDADAALETVAETHTERGSETWKVNQYYERLPDWEADSGRPLDTGPLEGTLESAGDIAAPQWEMYNLSCDADERDNLLAPGRDEPAEAAQLRQLLDKTRLDKRLVPRH